MGGMEERLGGKRGRQTNICRNGANRVIGVATNMAKLDDLRKRLAQLKDKYGKGPIAGALASRPSIAARTSNCSGEVDSYFSGSVCVRGLPWVFRREVVIKALQALIIDSFPQFKEDSVEFDCTHSRNSFGVMKLRSNDMKAVWDMLIACKGLHAPPMFPEGSSQSKLWLVLFWRVRKRQINSQRSTRQRSHAIVLCLKVLTSMHAFIFHQATLATPRYGINARGMRITSEV